MCNFLSALVMRDGSLRMHPMIDSHSELVEHFKLPDVTPYVQHFAKVELTPNDASNKSVMDVSTWQFRLDEESAPVWWDEIAERVEKKLRARADRMILRTGDHGVIVDGCWIVGGDAKVRELRSGRIVRLCGGVVSAINGGTVSEIRGGTVSAIYGGVVSAINGGTVSAIWGGTVSAIKPNDYYTLNLSDQAKAELTKRGILKAGAR